MCSRQIDTISVNPVIHVYSVAILEYNMAVIHHYGCHTPLNKILSNISTCILHLHVFYSDPNKAMQSDIG